VSEGPDVIIIKKKNKGHGAHGAAWKVAYADFVTAMMALFMVLWLVSQTDKKIKKVISEYFRTGVFSGAPSILEGGLGISARGFVDTQPNPGTINAVESDDDETNGRLMRTAVSHALGHAGFKGLAEHVSVKVTPEGVLLQIAEGRDDLLFDLSSAELKPPLVKLLAGLAPELTKLGHKLEIHGHTDARPFATAGGRNNWTLSFERAERARAELEKSGLPSSLIAGIYAHGSTIPIDADPLSPANRRLAIFARHESKKDDGKGKPSAAPADSAKGGEPSVTTDGENKEGAKHSAVPAEGATHGEEPAEGAKHGTEPSPSSKPPEPAENSKPSAAPAASAKPSPAPENEAPADKTRKRTHTRPTHKG
jgi:chemotaxis protein MotB